MKFVIQQQPQKREYTNLPPRRERVAAPQRSEASASVADEGTTPADMQQNRTVEYSHSMGISSDAGQATPQFELPWWRNSRWSPYLLAVAIVALGAIVYASLGFEENLPLQSIKVEGNTNLTAAEVIGLADVDRHQKFYDIDLKAITGRLLTHSLIKAAYPGRESNPQTIVLRIEERRPVALIRSQTSGEVLLIDEEGVVLAPKKLSGLKDPSKLLQVPMLTGVTSRDTADYLRMSRLVMRVQQINDGALADALGELKKTSTGAYVLYTNSTGTPIFIGAPDDEAFVTAIERERRQGEEQREQSHFDGQLGLLAKLWRTDLAPAIRRGELLYIDARFKNEVVVRRRDRGHMTQQERPIAVDTASVQRGEKPFMTEFAKGAARSPEPETYGERSAALQRNN